MSLFTTELSSGFCYKILQIFLVTRVNLTEYREENITLFSSLFLQESLCKISFYFTEESMHGQEGVHVFQRTRGMRLDTWLDI